MDRQALRGHLLVLMATISGIAGMGMVFRGIMHGSMVGISQGAPLLMIGLWWAGRELGRSMLASRARSLGGAVVSRDRPQGGREARTGLD